MSNKKNNVIQFIARLGFVGKGIVYSMVGLLALQAAIGISGNPSGTKQALEKFIYKPFGSVLLILCIAGLLAHGLWRLINAFLDPEARGDDAQDVFMRIIDFFTGLLYLSLSYAAWQIFRGLNTTSSDKSSEIWVGKILDLPYGKWLVFLIAIIIAITGLYQFYSAYTADFDYSFDKEEMSEKTRETLRSLGRIGIIAWGIVYEMMAFLFFQAANQYSADQAGGVADALSALQKQPYGFWVLGITALGLLTYGIYLLILSYYHQVFGS